MFEVGQAAVDGLGVIVRSSLLLGPFVQPLLQTVVGAGQEHHQVGSADLPGDRGGFVKSDIISYLCVMFIRELSLKAAKRGTGDSGQNVKTAIYTRVKIPFSVQSRADGFMIFFISIFFDIPNSRQSCGENSLQPLQRSCDFNERISYCVYGC